MHIEFINADLFPAASGRWLTIALRPLAIVSVCALWAWGGVSFADEAHWRGVQPGPWPVGFRLITTQDHSRTYGREDEPGDAGGRNGRSRPMPISVWYPAAEDPEASAMTLREYLVLDQIDDTVGEPSERDRALVAHISRGLAQRAGVDEASMAALLDRARPVWRDAPPAAGPFPLVLYAPSASAPASENAALCEQIASLGFVVTSTASRGLHRRPMTTDRAGLESQARDLEFTLAVMREQSWVDAEQLAVVGFSWGGFSNVVVAIRNQDVDAVVTLDGTIGSGDWSAATSQYAYFAPSRLRVPLLFVARQQSNFGKPASTVFYDGVLYADAYDMRVAHLGHGSFASRRVELAHHPTGARDTSDGGMTEAHAQIATAIGLFLDGYIRGSRESIERLRSVEPGPSAWRGPAELQWKTSVPAPPTEREFFDLVDREGLASGIQVFREARAIDQDYVPFSFKGGRDYGWVLQQSDDLDGAVRAFELLIEAYPDRADSHRRLGEALMLRGDRESSIKSLRRALELNLDHSAARSMLDRQGG